MRRYPLTTRLRDVVRSLGATLLLAGCSLGIGTTASSGVDIAVETAPGEQLAFVPEELRVPAGVPVRMTFRNGSSVAHNLVFTSGISAATKTIVDPGTTEELALATPGPGAYQFVCTIHDGMAGTLTVGAAIANG